MGRGKYQGSGKQNQGFKIDYSDLACSVKSEYDKAVFQKATSI